MNDEQIRELAEKYLTYIDEATSKYRFDLLVRFGQEVECRTRHRASVIAADSASKIHDRNYVAR